MSNNTNIAHNNEEIEQEQRDYIEEEENEE